MIARFAFDMIVFAFHLSDKRLTAGVTRLGWERGLADETEKTPSREKAPNNAARTPSRLHAELGSFCNHQHHLYCSGKTDSL